MAHRSPLNSSRPASGGGCQRSKKRSNGSGQKHMDSVAENPRSLPDLVDHHPDDPDDGEPE